MLALSLGDDITAASTIDVTHDVHRVVYSGTDIETINPPSPEFCGFVVLIAHDSNGSNVSVGNPPSGNIAIGKGMVPKSALILFYNPNTQKWYGIN